MKPIAGSHASASNPPVISGNVLHVEDGLERLMGDQKLYRQLLRRFRQDYRDAVLHMRRALSLGDTETAQRKAHTLKGAAGMVGAQALHQLAQDTELAFNTPGLQLHARMDLLEDGLHALLRAVDGFLNDTVDPADSVAAPAPSEHPPAGRMLIRRLAQLLDEGNGMAIDVLEQSASPLAAALGMAVFQAVAAAAHEYDFEAALEALKPSL